MEMNEVRLETERLVLRWFRDDDFDQYKLICADPEVMRFLGDGKPMTELEAWRHMAAIMGHWYFRGYGVWAVEEKATEKVIGRIGLMYPQGWPGFELGWMLGRAHWGKGYATEGARRALAFAFAELKQRRVISLIRPGNAASVRVAERLGERLEGSTTLFGQDALVYAIARP